MSAPVWRHCSSCKKPILCGTAYLVCSVSTCNRVRTGMVFCSMGCWDAHIPIARHREASAEELMAPKSPAGVAPKPGATERKSTGRRLIAPAKRRNPNLPKETLVVTKALKAYVKASGDGMRTSDAVMEVLSEKLRDMCDRAIARAKDDERKTILDRDFMPK